MKKLIAIILIVTLTSCGTSKPTIIYFESDSSLDNDTGNGRWLIVSKHDTDYWYTRDTNKIQVIDTVTGTIYYCIPEKDTTIHKK